MNRCSVLRLEHDNDDNYKKVNCLSGYRGSVSIPKDAIMIPRRDRRVTHGTQKHLDTKQGKMAEITRNMTANLERMMVISSQTGGATKKMTMILRQPAFRLQSVRISLAMKSPALNREI